MKKKIEKTIYSEKTQDQLKWKDIKHLELEDDDEILSVWEDADHDENPYWYSEITRMVEETDSQYEKRLVKEAGDAERMKEMRYQSYLKLKKEFENGK